jgi:hypothetical protein
MKTILFSLLLISGALLSSCNREPNKETQTINPLIGDISFIKKFGHKPGAGAGEDLRIQTHLEYAETVLRQKNVPGLSPELRQKREHLLDLLHHYWSAGIFPRNYDHNEERKPCFIDKDNRICAVGYLIEQTAGRPVAENINGKHKYDRVLEMKDEMVDSWIASSGLTKDECALIQPQYASPNNNYISWTYGVSSAVLGGMNVSLSAINVSQLSRGAKNKTVAIIGMVTGAGQIVLGAASFPKQTGNAFYGNTTNENKKTLSLVNIGVGTTTLLLSAWNFFDNRKPKDKKTTWNINSFEAQGDVGVAFTLTRRL